MVLLESFEREGFNEGDLEIDLRCGRYSILSTFLSLKIQVNYFKWFWKGKIVEQLVHTWANITSNTSLYYKKRSLRFKSYSSPNFSASPCLLFPHPPSSVKFISGGSLKRWNLRRVGSLCQLHWHSQIENNEKNCF